MMLVLEYALQKGTPIEFYFEAQLFTAEDVKVEAPQ